MAGITKQTDRVQIDNFGKQGIALFDDVEIQIKQLLEETAMVAYKGANALEFKTKCVGNAVDFGNKCVQNMTMMSEVITSAVTFIASNLGGANITLDPPTKAFDPPAIDADTSVESATDGPLRDLARSTGTIYDAIQTSFGQNLTNFRNLGATGWIGPEYDEALSQVEELTRMIMESTDQSRTTMTNDINNQLTALGFAAA